MSLGALLERVEDERTRLVRYAGGADGDPLRGFEPRNASVIRRQLPDEEGFVVVRNGDDFLGAVPAARLRTLLEPPVGELDDVDGRQAGRTALFGLLEDTLFAPLERRNLQVASREIERFAWRVGRGRREVGFQQAGAFDDQRPVYERLAAETDLDIHVHAASIPDEPLDGVTFHADASETVERFWFLTFDGAGDDERTRAPPRPAAGRRLVLGVLDLRPRHGGRHRRAYPGVRAVTFTPGGEPFYPNAPD